MAGFALWKTSLVERAVVNHGGGHVDERSGRIMNPSLAAYHVPVHLHVPEIDVIWTDEPDPHAPVGARGVGEIGITGVGAAVANAMFNATGKRVRDLPITLDKLM
jgi:xanthine dehydrogenase YagR molybdenum-binding subunit